ncbi:hypothetical protein ABH935_005428 [Catenulispora sp. GAS73]|uniref:hypothetical protein n=1 Tax=Catenulispora sp. GAS73 TaxID=3156269 RepID=UPI003513AF5B
MNPVGAGRVDPQRAERETDVIEACQRWLDLDFPDRPASETASTVLDLTEGEPR